MSFRFPVTTQTPVQVSDFGHSERRYIIVAYSFAFGVPLKVLCPRGYTWNVRAVYLEFTASAVAGNRYPVVRWSREGSWPNTVFMASEAAQVTTAGLTRWYSWMPGAASLVGGSGIAHEMIGLPTPFVMEDGDGVSIDIVGGAAGDAGTFKVVVDEVID